MARAQIRVAEAEEVLRLRSPLLFRWFVGYSRRHVRRHFRALRLSMKGPAPGAELLGDGPLVVLMNHPSWWDALVGLILTEQLPDRAHFAPMDAGPLRSFRFFKRLGFFGIEPGTIRGAARFLRVSEGILSRPGSSLWITAQGTFVDARERPVSIRSGIAHLAARLQSGHVLPLAVEYTFWDERYPEALAAFGAPIAIQGGPSNVREWKRLLEVELEAAQDRLARDARAREPERFQAVLRGRGGVGGVYGAWLRLRALFAGGSTDTALPGRGGRP